MSTAFEGSREDYFSDLMSWAQENGASCDGFTVANFESEGYGLRATRDIKVAAQIVCAVNNTIRQMWRDKRLLFFFFFVGRGVVLVGSQEDVDDGGISPKLSAG